MFLRRSWKDIQMKLRTSRDLCILFTFTNFFFCFVNNSLTNGIIGVIMLASAFWIDTHVQKGL